MTRKEEIMQQLQQLAAFQQQTGHVDLPSLLLEKGNWFEGRVDSGSYEVIRDWIKENEPQAMECFKNAQDISTEYDDCRYFEGYAQTKPGLLAVPHGWVVMPDGKVVDVTLEAAERLALTKDHVLNTANTVYFGVEIPSQYVLMTLLQRNAFEPVAVQYFTEQGWKR